MTERKDNGGPAFPTAEDEHLGRFLAHPGMSLRDYTAIKVLAGLLASADVTVPAGAGTIEEIAQHFAETAYVYADAMLAERAKA